MGARERKRTNGPIDKPPVGLACGKRRRAIADSGTLTKNYEPERRFWPADYADCADVVGRAPCESRTKASPLGKTSTSGYLRNLRNLRATIAAFGMKTHSIFTLPRTVVIAARLPVLLVFAVLRESLSVQNARFVVPLHASKMCSSWSRFILCKNPQPVLLRHQNGERTALAEPPPFFAKILQRLEHTRQSLPDDCHPFTQAVFVLFGIVRLRQKPLNPCGHECEFLRLFAENARNHPIHIERTFIDDLMPVHVGGG